MKTSIDSALQCVYADTDAARVGNDNVSVQTTILPMPRKEVIAIGTRITQALAGR